MQQELQDKVYNWVADTAETIGDWTSKEVPLFITEFLTWRFWESMIGIIQYGGGIVIFTILLCFWYKIAYKGLLKLHEKFPKDCWNVIAHLMAVTTAAISITAIALNFPTENIKTCIQIKLAPKVYLVEEAIKLTK
tara:strand:+ start:3089 stop:3496 length:408 start_codon:yes stop_codon:yes gene_type:complete